MSSAPSSASSVEEDFGFARTAPPAALETVVEDESAPPAGASPRTSRRNTPINDKGPGTPPVPISKQSIEHYKMLKTIGKGNFAKVKLARHILTGAEVAVKIIDKSNLNESSLAKLMREVSIMKNVDHPNIVKLFEVIDSKKYLYLVMEYAAGGEVFDYLVTHGRMKEKEARAKFREIVSAVQYCHSRNVIHRDLKAENLLLDKDMHIKIADFGFSYYFTPGDKLETFCGSPPYAAPELFQGKKYEGPEVDIWSLGVILYTLVSGSLPFDGSNLKELRERVLHGKYRIPFYISTECEQLLKHFLVLSPTKRSSLTTVMRDPWMNMGYESDPLEPFQPQEPDFNDEKRLKQMEKMGFKRDEVKKALESGVYNQITATYLLLEFAPEALNNAQTAHPKRPHSSAAGTVSGATAASVAPPVTSAALKAQRMERRRSSGTFQTAVSGGQGQSGPPGAASSGAAAAARRTSAPVSPHKQFGRRHSTALAVSAPGSGASSPVPPQRGEMASTHAAPADGWEPRFKRADTAPSRRLPMKPGERPPSSGTPGQPPRTRHHTESDAAAAADTPSSPRDKNGAPNPFLGSIRRRLGSFSRQKTDRPVTPSGEASGSVFGMPPGTSSPKPRSLRFTFSMTNTSEKSAKEVLAETMRALTANNISYTQEAPFLLSCVFNDVSFEMEVCKLPRLSVNGIRVKRLGGPSLGYKNICSKVLDDMKL